MNLKQLNNLVETGYIKKRLHPYLDLNIYNYSEKCAYERFWNETTMACRGLVLNYHGNIIARPWKKFFNIDQPEAPSIPNEEFEVYEKMDGSLIIIFVYEGELVIASRGSFVSDQAFWAREIIDTYYPNILDYIEEGKTYLCELIHPKNRIVVDYGKSEDLVLLSVIENDGGGELDMVENSFGCPIVRRYTQYKDIASLPEKDNSEGYVIRFRPSNTRLKIKNPRYIAIHRIRFDFSKKRAWEALSQGINPLDDMAGIPDEFFNEMEDTVKKVQDEYESVNTNAWRVYNKLQDQGFDNRKDAAIWINGNAGKLKGVLFQMLSDKDYSDTIWRMIKPGKESDVQE